MHRHLNQIIFYIKRLIHINNSGMAWCAFITKDALLFWQMYLRWFFVIIYAHFSCCICWSALPHYATLDWAFAKQKIYINTNELMATLTMKIKCCYFLLFADASSLSPDCSLFIFWSARLFGGGLIGDLIGIKSAAFTSIHCLRSCKKKTNYKLPF